MGLGRVTPEHGGIMHREPWRAVTPALLAVQTGL